MSTTQLPTTLQNNKPGPTRTHTIVMEEEQLVYIRQCIELAAQHSERLHNETDRWDNHIGDMLVQLIDDTCSTTEQDYNHDMVNGFCL